MTALWDAFPVNRGHALIVPRRHVPTWFDASAEERVALMAAVDEARERRRALGDSRHGELPVVQLETSALYFFVVSCMIFL